MKIVADENIVYVKEIFTPLGLIECLPGRSMTCGTLKGADVLLVRSVTSVNAELLEGTSVRFVGTCTIGTDHIDTDYLKKRGIAFADAVGSNANSVAEYVLTAILVLARQKGWDLNGKTLGVIGVGNIGSIIEKKAPALGLKVLPNDPPLQRKTADPRFVSLDEALQADIISLHVPLTTSGPDPTFHLINEKNLPRLKPHTVLINTSRGPVVDNHALKNCLTARTIGPTVLDVWENEPNIDPQLLDLVAIGTAHVAGYSLDGKANGTAMLYAAVCDFFHLTGKANIAALLPEPPVPLLQLDSNGGDQQVLTKAMTGIYDIMRDDRSLREIIPQPPDKIGKFFDQLRKNYPVRREAHNTLVKLTPSQPALARKLGLLGFQSG